ncbi:MAG TPA: hypothetical protein VMV56_07510 [Williamwhitmania sp.]|nr:hypothetical protein [Williamwhitmania sp.]
MPGRRITEEIETHCPNCETDTVHILDSSGSYVCIEDDCNHSITQEEIEMNDFNDFEERGY